MRMCRRQSKKGEKTVLTCENLRTWTRMREESVAVSSYRIRNPRPSSVSTDLRLHGGERDTKCGSVCVSE